MNANFFAVDSRGIRRYKCALFLAGTLTVFAVGAHAKENLVVKGAILPPGSVQVGEDRYKSPLNWLDTLEFYRKQYRGNPRKTIVNQPGIRAVHVVNDGKGEWEGLNVYEQDQETRIYVVPRDPPPAVTPKASSPAPKPSKDGRPAGT